MDGPFQLHSPKAVVGPFGSIGGFVLEAVMLRLKELEALEKIADKVQTLTVHNGTQGLLEDIVSLRGPKPAPKRKAAN